MHRGSAYAPTPSTPRRPATNAFGPRLFPSSARLPGLNTFFGSYNRIPFPPKGRVPGAFLANGEPADSRRYHCGYNLNPDISAPRTHTMSGDACLSCSWAQTTDLGIVMICVALFYSESMLPTIAERGCIHAASILHHATGARLPLVQIPMVSPGRLA